MFTGVLSGVQDLALIQHSKKKTMTMVSAFKLFVAHNLHEYVTTADKQMARNFALNFMMIQS